jgi:hypothetical protein
MLAIAELRARPKAEHFYRPLRLRDGLVFCFISQHFVLGYFRQVPTGLIFSNHQGTCVIPIASPYVNADGSRRTQSRADPYRFTKLRSKARFRRSSARSSFFGVSKTFGR